MYGLYAFGATFLLALCRLIIWPVAKYFIDHKGLRKYPNMTFWSGISDLPFMLEAARGYRCGRLAELHKVHPVIRIGPDTLSYGDLKAIKVRLSALGHFD